MRSAKLTLLDKLLARLKADGHRVLLYSQMTRMLDILQDYLDLRGFSYQRLDGSCRGIDRYEAVKNFSQVPGRASCVCVCVCLLMMTIMMTTCLRIQPSLVAATA